MYIGSGEGGTKNGVSHMKTINYITKKIQRQGIRKVLRLGYIRTMRPVYPESIVVEIMNKCNLKCKHCRVTYYGNVMDDVDPIFMEFEYFTKIVDRISPLIRKAYRFQFSTVEPLFHKDIFRMMDYVSKYNKNIDLGILSNGMLLNEKIINELMRRNVSSISISLDGYKKETVEAFKTNVNYDRLISNIRLLTKICKNKIEVNAVFVATRANIDELVEYVGFCKSLGIDRILVNGFQSFFHDFSHLYLYSKQGNPEVQKIFQCAYDKAKSNHINIEFPSLVAKPSVCGMHSTMIIDDRGNIAPCIHLARKAHFELFSESKVSDPVVWGNIFDEDPLAIWRSKNSVQFRAKLKSKEIPDECSLCVDAYGVGCSRKLEVLKETT